MEDMQSSKTTLADNAIASKTASSNSLNELISFVESLLSTNLSTPFENDFEKFASLLDSYQEQPHLLDSRINDLISPLINRIKISWQDLTAPPDIVPFKLLCHIAKVRGPKVFIRRLPHDVDDLAQILNYLIKNKNCYEIRYISLLWLTLSLKSPFDLVLLLPENESLSRLLEYGSEILFKYSDKSSEAACWFICELVGRNDFCQDEIAKNQFQKLILDCGRRLTEAKTSREKVASLLLLNYMFKRLSKRQLLEYADQVLQQLFESKLGWTASDIVLRKLATKLVQRVGLIMLKPKNADWLYKKQIRRLFGEMASHLSGNAGSSMQTLPEPLFNNSDDQMALMEDLSSASNLLKDQKMSTSIPEIVNFLLQKLKDNHNIVRWSAAKGVGRICSKLPFNLAHEVIVSLEANFNERETDSVWHGSCLAFAELGRRGCLTPDRLPSILDCVVKALRYERLMGSYSVGTQVRDAACYICWTLARAFDIQDLALRVDKLAPTLVTVAVFDPEITCRRAASAAFQEIVGRLPTVFPDGLPISKIIDFFAVGNIENCYTNLVEKIANFQAYLPALLNNLSNERLNNFDPKIRRFASLALGKLCKFLTDRDIETLVEELLKGCKSDYSFARNGSLLALGEILIASTEKMMTSTNFDNLLKLPDELDTSHLTDGIGGDTTRLGLLIFLNNFVHVLPIGHITVQRMEAWFNILFSSLTVEGSSAIFDEMRQKSAETLENFAQKSQHLPYSFKEKILTKFQAMMQSSLSENEKTSGAIGLGCCASFLNSTNFEDNLKPLLAVFSVTQNRLLSSWVYFKSSCLKSTSKIVRQALANQFCDKQSFESSIGSILVAFDDYTTNARGDVGNLVRKAAVQAILEIFQERSRIAFEWQNLQHLALCKLIETSFDRLSTVSRCSFDALKSILNADGGESFPHSISLKSVLLNENCSAQPNDLLEFLHCSEYAPYVLRGLVNSAGNLQETPELFKDLQKFLNLIKDHREKLKEFLSEICNLIHQIGTKKDQRLTLPLLKILEFLTAGEYLDDFRDLVPLNVVYDFAISKLRSKNIATINMACSVLCSALKYHEVFPDLMLKIMENLEFCLNHEYPLVRVKTAENLQLSLLKNYSLDNHSEWILSALASTDWLQGSAEELCDVNRKIFGKLKFDA